jgi:hypothetical protein
MLAGNGGVAVTVYVVGKQTIDDAGASMQGFARNKVR